VREGSRRPVSSCSYRGTDRSHRAGGWGYGRALQTGPRLTRRKSADKRRRFHDHHRFVRECLEWAEPVGQARQNGETGGWNGRGMQGILCQLGFEGAAREGNSRPETEIKLGKLCRVFNSSLDLPEQAGMSEGTRRYGVACRRPGNRRRGNACRNHLRRDAVPRGAFRFFCVIFRTHAAHLLAAAEVQRSSHITTGSFVRSESHFRETRVLPRDISLSSPLECSGSPTTIPDELRQSDQFGEERPLCRGCWLPVPSGDAMMRIAVRTRPTRCASVP